ncbi:hypothetical protein FOZ60_005348 [Perkinsus olseni]|uniref:Hexosyltransferase n=1 Tax=Perkinsus olseni TaxID=32597 RepID=A0A7J6NR82_PEROL|nr:hypothetical protein FOZ60_005348 [Perkinsus olseni]
MGLCWRECRGRGGGVEYDWDLVIVIPSHITEFSRRCAVRDGWARQLRGHEQNNRAGLRTIKLVFTVGAHYPDNSTRDTAMAEMKQFDDIITLPPDFNDYYRNLATKTRLSIHEIVHRTNSFKLLLKADTDSYVHVDRLLDFIDSTTCGRRAGRSTQEPSRPPTSFGTLETRTINGRYDGEFAELTGIEKYPWHAKGAGYMLSYKLAKYLSDPPVPLRSWIHEDVGIGAWLMPVSWERVDMPVRFMEPQCDCATSCTHTMFHQDVNDPNEVVVIDHYVPEYLHRWRQRRFELFADDCWAPRPSDTASPLVDIEPSAAATADYLPPVEMGFYDMKYQFEPLRSRAKPPIIPSHADTRSGVCQISFTFEDVSEPGSLGLRASKSYRVCRGSDGSIYDDFECDEVEREEDRSVEADWKDRSSSSSCSSSQPPLLQRGPLTLNQCLQLASINDDKDGRGSKCCLPLIGRLRRNRRRRHSGAGSGISPVD